MFAPQAIFDLFDAIRAEPDLGSVLLGGIEGDAAHVQSGGYHIARQTLIDNGMGSDYSIQLPPDKLGDRWACSALDSTFGATPLQHTVTQRLLDAGARKDPRVKRVLREFYGSVDGVHVVGWDFSQDAPATTDDMSHLFHIHISIYREFSENYSALRPVADVFAGLPSEDPLEEMIMAMYGSKAEFEAAMQAQALAALQSPAGQQAILDMVNRPWRDPAGHSHLVYTYLERLDAGFPLTPLPVPDGKHEHAEDDQS